METTLDVFNKTLYAGLTPDCLLSWTRAVIANTLASDGPSWANMFSWYNRCDPLLSVSVSTLSLSLALLDRRRTSPDVLSSFLFPLLITTHMYSGTYCNQWIVVDYNKFTSGQPLAANALTIAEQLPVRGPSVCVDVRVSVLVRVYFSRWQIPSHSLANAHAASPASMCSFYIHARTRSHTPAEHGCRHGHDKLPEQWVLRLVQPRVRSPRRFNQWTGCDGEEAMHSCARAHRRRSMARTLLTTGHRGLKSSGEIFSTLWIPR